MKIELIGFSQGVSFDKKELTLNYLDFRREDGKIFRLPVPAETLHALMVEIYEEQSRTAAAPEATPAREEIPSVPDEDEDDVGTIFGEDGEVEGIVMTPGSEDEVPSL